jgi:predicted transcriptional regulator
MLITGPSAARAFLKSCEANVSEIDDILASLLRKGYIQWNSVTEEFTLTEKGVLETHQGVMH